MDKVDRYIALANLKKIAPEVGVKHLEEFWHIVRSLAVLDWTLRQTGMDENGNVVTPELPEAHFETIMRKVQHLAESIQEEMTVTLVN